MNAAKIQPGDTVLVWGAAGGVGSFVVQLAKQAGARVIATGRAGAAEYLKHLGADETVDYKSVAVVEETLRRVPAGVDAVIDVAHISPAIEEAAAAARPGGRVVYVLGGPPPAFDRGVTATYAGAEAPAKGGSTSWPRRLPTAGCWWKSAPTTASRTRDRHSATSPRSTSVAS